MNFPIQNEVLENQPVYGDLYNFFSNDEVEWMSSISKLKSMNSRKSQAKQFMQKHPNLKELEVYLNTEILKGEINWYIVALAAFGRIRLDIGILSEISISRRDMLMLRYSPIINFEFIKKFQDTAKHIGYADSTISIFLVPNLIRITLYYQKPVDRVVENFEELFRKLININGLANKLCIRGISNVLSEIGYSEHVKNILKAAIVDEYQKSFINEEKRELEECLNEYADFLKGSHSHRTYVTEMSHLRAVLNYLYKFQPNINRLSDINNKVIVEFIKNQQEIINCFGRKNKNATINHRIQALQKMLMHFKRFGKYYITDNIITKYDYLREPKTYPKYIAKKDIFRVILAVKNAIKNEVYSSQLQELYIILVIIDTGRRISEVRHLKYNCLINGKVIFHKTKNGKPSYQTVGETTINAILKSKEYASKIKKQIYSDFDKQKIRRLFPSMKKLGRTLISGEAVSNVFKKIQIGNGIVDDKNDPLYTLHDNKRNFVTNMLAANVGPEEIAKHLNQNINTLLPYEVNNEIAIETLKIVQSKRLLLGESFDNRTNNEDENNEIIKLINNTDVVIRHKENLIQYINRPQDAFPLFMGMCTDNDNVDVCGDLVCMACETYKPENIDEFEKYAIKVLRYANEHKRFGNMKKVESQLFKALNNVYMGIENISHNSFKQKIKEIKREAKTII